MVDEQDSHEISGLYIKQGMHEDSHVTYMEYFNGSSPCNPFGLWLSMDK